MISQIDKIVYANITLALNRFAETSEIKQCYQLSKGSIFVGSMVILDLFTNLMLLQRIMP
jgi:hypothetical protein